MVKKLDHIAITVNNIEKTAEIFFDLFGLKMEHVETVKNQNVRVGFLPIGDTQLELVEPLKGNEQLRKYIDKKGSGLHHLCFEVDDIEREMEVIEAKGGIFVDKSAREGSHQTKIAFVHPKATGGTLVEIAQKKI